MSKQGDQWQHFWASKADPLTGGNEADHSLLWDELRLILPKGCQSVLEVGCGSGDLYEPLGFDRLRYQGIDYSPAMIEAFRTRYPEADVAVSDLRDYKGQAGLDLIFSHGVVQFISIRDFEDQIAQSRILINKGGYICHTSALRRSSRDAFLAGELWEQQEGLLKKQARRLAEICGLRRTMGNWYAISDIRAIARRHGFTVKFYGSLFYPYRFHIVMQKQGD